MVYLVPLGRFLYSAIFLMTAFGHFSAGYIGYAAQAGVPAPGLLVPLSGVIAIVGGLSITLGYKAKIGGWLIVLFLVPVLEERIHAGRRAADHALWGWPLEPRRAAASDVLGLSAATDAAPCAGP